MTHWVDDLSAHLLAFAARGLAASPALFVVTFRPDAVLDVPLVERVLASLAGTLPLERLTLGTLDREHVVSIVRAVVSKSRAADAPEALVDRAWRMSEGHPFMAIAAARDALTESADVSDADDRIPASVHDLVVARLARLSAPSRRLAAVAAVIGGSFPLALLEGAAGLRTTQVTAAVEELVQRRILEPAGDRLRFTHARIRDVIHAGILLPVRARLHATVARTIGTLHAGDLDPWWGALAAHHGASGAWPRVVACAREAGRLAFDRADCAQAVALFERALDALQRGPQTPEHVAGAVDVRIELQQALRVTGPLTRVRAGLEEAQALAERLGDRRRAGRIAGEMTAYQHLAGSPVETLVAGERALAIAQGRARRPAPRRDDLRARRRVLRARRPSPRRGDGA